MGVSISAELEKLGGRLQDLHRHLLDLGLPIEGVSQSSISFLPEATEEQQTAANAVLAGWDWNASPVPDTVAMHGLRKALRRLVIYDDPEIVTALDLIDQYILAPGNEDLMDDVQYAPYVRRDHPSVLLFKQFLGKDENDVDDLFREALTLSTSNPV